jgi:hypothetical protein
MQGLLDSSVRVWVKRGLIGRESAEIKDLRPIQLLSSARRREKQAVVNHDFMLG